MNFGFMIFVKYCIKCVDIYKINVIYNKYIPKEYNQRWKNYFPVVVLYLAIVTYELGIRREYNRNIKKRCSLFFMN